MSSWIPEELRRRVAARANNVCEYCLIPESDTHLGCEVDHILSEKHGGQTIFDNLAYACFFCNRHKGTDLATIAPASQKLVRLYNPRTDSWFNNFHLSGNKIEGKTEIGKGTAKLLQFNSPERIFERALISVGSSAGSETD